MKVGLCITAFCLCSWVYGQERIDFDYARDFNTILADTKADSSPIYFATLFPRFLQGDTTLTNEEMLALQIGYTDHAKYWPYQDVQIEREIWNLNEEGKYEQALLQCDQLLANNPFNLLANREKGYAFSKLSSPDSAQIYINRFDLVALSDLSTGDGLSYESSWFVLSPADGQWIIRLAFQEDICSMGSGRDSEGNFHDILGIQFEDSEECTNLFFNIEHAASRMFGPEGLKLTAEPDKKKKRRKRSKVNE